MPFPPDFPQNPYTILLVDKILVDGEFIRPHGTEEMDIINPSTSEKMATVVLGDEEDARQAIEAARCAFRVYSQTTAKERQECLRRLRDAVLERAGEMTDACVQEYGAPVGVARARTSLTANAFAFAVELLDEFEFVERVGQAKVVLEPLGVAGIITPWNASSSQIAMKLASVLAAGCTAVIKPSELSATQTGIMMECLAAAGLPAGVVNLVNGRGEVVGNEISSNPGVDLVSFTGSTRAGQAIYRNSAESMKRITLELGGKSPNVILDDADLGQALPQAVLDCYGNNGQMCIAASRLLVPEARLDEALALVKKAAESVKVGYPWEEETMLGPLATLGQFERVQGYIRKGLEEGAQLLTGGLGRVEGLEGGYFARPTVFHKVKNSMAIAREEIFGPVLSVISYRDEDEAVEIANDSPYGLAAYVSSTDLDRANRIAGRLVAGRVVINGPRNDLKAPFGGFRLSGLGREYGAYGLRACLEPKTILGPC
ncbi:MAG: aldehyde dehydrogenase family protein [Deltaproteobacteria bacterium]|jgi:aldehyde dehydrogenase (NAD+)|nr:aldehyde dehydrogenase family protein [Deltaproteobacteria bacterium]